MELPPPPQHQARLDDAWQGNLRAATINYIATADGGGLTFEHLLAALQPLLQGFPPCDSSEELRIALGALEEDFLIYRNGERVCLL